MKSISSALCGLDVNCPHSLMSCLLAPAAGDAILADAQNLRRILKETLCWVPLGTGMGSCGKLPMFCWLLLEVEVVL